MDELGDVAAGLGQEYGGGSVQRSDEAVVLGLQRVNDELEESTWFSKSQHGHQGVQAWISRSGNAGLRGDDSWSTTVAKVQ